ncbi:hypothetical protein [Sphingobium sp. SA916]|uniref:hypothetical protein n=1 Tax=Sphingobium sp. SA916 TaxID=1851207 RepID=UPI0011AF3EED|nr:hypothetical protein [Sphingobium sp. SA916]
MSGDQEIVFGTGDRAIIEPWDEKSAYRLENLICVDETGVERWRASLPENSGPDCFVAISVEEGQLVATTWSGQRIEIDSISGKHRRTVFVK